jgi:YjbE family integral membrane protein
LNPRGSVEAIAIFAMDLSGLPSRFIELLRADVETKRRTTPMEAFLTAEFWVAVGQIIMIDILLGGDNAVVIALACRKLPPAQRTQGILWGTAGAIVLRVVLIFFALTLLAIPFLKLAGALLLLWIGIKLLVPEQEGHEHIGASDKLWAAVKTVIVADLVMSVDNVIAIAGAAESVGAGHQMPLVVFGLLASIPIIVWGSRLVIRLMDRLPVIITLGGMLLGWIAGTMGVSDPAVADPEQWTWVPKLPQTGAMRYAAGGVGALLVLVIGRWMAGRGRGPAAA